MNLYEPFVSKSKNKKYSVYVLKEGGKTLIHFGDKRYGQYKDKLGNYSNLDHKDKKRQKSYLSRAKGIKNKQGCMSNSSILDALRTQARLRTNTTPITSSTMMAGAILRGKIAFQMVLSQPGRCQFWTVA